MKSWCLINSKEQGAILEMREVPQPKPGIGEMLVRVRAAALNRGEFIARHKGSSQGIGKPCGIECAGEIIQIGAGVDDLKLGDRVMGRTSGAFSEYAIVSVGNVIKVPKRLSWGQAGTATITFMTAYDMLWPGGSLQPHEWLLVTGVSSGVGVAALQLGKMLGSNVIGTSRSPEKLKKLKEIGLDFGLSVSDEKFESQVKEITDGKGVDLVVNNVGGSAFSKCVRILAYQGRLATVGYVDGETRVELDLIEQHTKRLKLFGVSNKMRSPEEIAKSVKDFTRDVLPAFANGRLVPLIDKVYNFDELPLALEYMRSNAHLGNIVIRN